jgi:HlyD family secretion protein
MKKNGMLLGTAVGVTLVFLSVGCSPKAENKDAAASGDGKAAVQSAANMVAPVDVVPAQTVTVTRTINVTGSLLARDSVSLTPKINNQRIVFVVGREGTIVHAGEVVVQQDTADLVHQLQQAQANLGAAQANEVAAQATVQSDAVKVTQAQTNVNLQVTTAKVGIEDAQQQLQSAQANLYLTKRPQRDQEVAVAENNVKQAQANYDKAKTDSERYEQLVKEGAAAQSTLDQYVMQEKVTKASLDSAQQQLDIAKEGGRVEEIQASATQVTRSEGQLRQAKANEQQIQVREDDLRAARAQLAQAIASVKQAHAAVTQQQAAVALAKQAVEDASIRSPIDGIISARSSEPGQMAAPGNPVLSIVALSTVYFEAQIPETDVNHVQAGQNVPLKLDAFPGRTFIGTVAKLFPSGDMSSRIFNARVEIDNKKAELRPGMFARGAIVAEQRKAVTVPVEAILTDPIGSLNADEAKAALANTRLYIVSNGVAQARKVQPGLLTADGKRVEVNGVQDGEQVVVAGQHNLHDGSKVVIHQEGSPEPQNQQQAQAESSHSEIRS